MAGMEHNSLLGTNGCQSALSVKTECVVGTHWIDSLSQRIGRWEGWVCVAPLRLPLGKDLSVTGVGFSAL